MARFAKDCLRKFSVVTRKLECALGPDTSSLAVRIGLHSGAITGGVLRGERARFQLFGDTVSGICYSWFTFVEDTAEDVVSTNAKFCLLRSIQRLAWRAMENPTRFICPKPL